jgi:hypothetical protein
VLVDWVVAGNLAGFFWMMPGNFAGLFLKSPVWRHTGSDSDVPVLTLIFFTKLPQTLPDFFGNSQ